MTEQAHEGTIVYCIARARSVAAGPPIQARGLSESGVRLIPHRDLVAIVGDADKERYQVSRSNVTAHQKVIDEVMQVSDVLPLRFGEVAPNDQDVREHLLDPQYDGLVKRLDRVHDRVELALRVSFDEPKLIAELFASHPELANASQNAVSLDDRIALGQKISALVESERDRESERLLKELRPLAVDVSVGQPTSEQMVLNAAFLVDRARLNEFDERVRGLGQQAGDRLVFKYVGPLPPYSFVELHIPAEA